MDEQTFNNQEINEFYQEDFDNVDFDYSTSQNFDTQSEITDTNFSATSSTSSLSSSLVWEHFDRSPPSVKNSLCNCIIAHIFNFITQRFNF
jgi:hypothetical protein